MSADIQSDYLVIGAGAAAMIFVDTLLSETDRTMTIVDRRDQPGGHWNDAYPFVRLHGSADRYGVASRRLGADFVDTDGFNAGFRSLATKSEILDHFDQAMRQSFLPTGRVTWLPKHAYEAAPDGRHLLRSLVDGSVREAGVLRRLVDSTRSNVRVPATHPPRYRAAPDVALIPVGGLVDVERSPAGFCIVGGGKTAMDACIWLIERGVDPSRIRWVKSREAWVHERSLYRDVASTKRFRLDLMRCFADASSAADFWTRAEACGLVSRVDVEVEPTAYRCATLSEREIHMLRRIRDVVRLGRLKLIEPSRLLLDHGSVEAEPDTLYVDCTAPAWDEPNTVPVFERDRINLQLLQHCLFPVSMALTAFVEGRYDDDGLKNALCRPVPRPNVPSDIFRATLVSLANAAEWQKRPEILAWKSRCRLDLSAHAASDAVRNDDEIPPPVMASIVDRAKSRLSSLIAEIDDGGEP